MKKEFVFHLLYTHPTSLSPPVMGILSDAKVAQIAKLSAAECSGIKQVQLPRNLSPILRSPCWPNCLPPSLPPRRSSGGRGVGGGAVRARVPRGVGEARLRPKAEALGKDLREHQQDARTDRAAEAALMLCYTLLAV